MPTPTHKLFIDGELVDTADHYDLLYPYTGAIAGIAARAGGDEMEAAIAAAARAFAETRRLTRAIRAQILLAISHGIAGRREEFERAITWSTGKPIDYSRAEVSRTIGVFALAAEEVKRFLAEPTTYRELGTDYFDRFRAERLKRRSLAQLQRLGYEVTLTPLPTAA
jgi:acyl-CoA reductase-like NAD-dependent aldehyde dehydrogenase